MSLEGFKANKRREFCNDIKCNAQTKLNKLNNIPNHTTTLDKPVELTLNTQLGNFIAGL